MMPVRMYKPHLGLCHVMLIACFYLGIALLRLTAKCRTDISTWGYGCQLFKTAYKTSVAKGLDVDTSDVEIMSIAAGSVKVESRISVQSEAAGQEAKAVLEDPERQAIALDSLVDTYGNVTTTDVRVLGSVASPPPPSVSPSPATVEASASSSSIVVIGGAVGGGVTIILLLLLIWYLKKRGSANLQVRKVTTINPCIANMLLILLSLA